MRYIMMHLFGGSLLLAGILLHVTQTGSIVFNYLEGGLSAYLILSGFALNAAIPPLHAWLTDAYPEGTVTGSVYLSAFTTKAAVCVLARGFASWEILIWAGAVMAVYGVVFAFIQNDIRRLLAYHIISQVGYMVCAIGLGTEMAINGAVAHAINNILYKSLLFMGAGTILYMTGRNKMTELGGMAKAMPFVLILYMIGAFSISGFPLFNGFVSKSLVTHAAEMSHMGSVVLLLNLASIGTFLCIGLKLPYFTWFGPKRSIEPKAIPAGMYVGMTLIAIVCIAIGVFPPLLYNILPFPVDYQPYTLHHVMQVVQLLLATGIGFWLLSKKLSVERSITLDVDWFYRRPARLAYIVFVVFPSRVFAAVEEVALRITRSSIRFGSNPISYFSPVSNLMGQRITGVKRQDVQLQDYDPNKYRIMVGAMILILLVAFITSITWSLFAS